MNKLEAILVSLMAGAASNGDAQDAKGPKVGFSTLIANDYVAKPGFVFGSGPVNQSTLSFSFNDVIRKGDSLSAFGWSNYDLTDGEMHEVDVGVSYSQGFDVKGGKIRVSASPQYWFYPSHLIGKFDPAFDAGINYSHKLGNADFLLRNILEHDAAPFRQIYYLTFSKTMKKEAFSFTPGVTFSFIRGFPRTDDGLAHITPRANFKINGKNSSIFWNLGYQFGVNTEKIKDTPVTSLGISYNFK